MKVRLGDDNHIQVEGKGVIGLSNGEGKVKHLYNVFFVPSLPQNLLIVGQLMSNGYLVLFDNSSCVIKDKETN